MKIWWQNSVVQWFLVTPSCFTDTHFIQPKSKCQKDQTKRVSVAINHCLDEDLKRVTKQCASRIRHHLISMALVSYRQTQSDKMAGGPKKGPSDNRLVFGWRFKGAVLNRISPETKILLQIIFLTTYSFINLLERVLWVFN